MAHKFKDLQMKMSAERRARVEERVRQAIKEIRWMSYALHVNPPKPSYLKF